MKGCHFQDIPKKKSVCLRTLCQPGETRPHYRTCDEQREERCHYREWDIDVRMRVVRQRSELTDICPGCGKRNDDLAELFTCICRHRMEEAFNRSFAYLVEGSGEDLFEGAPVMIRTSMWRKLRTAVIERDGGVCQDCGRALGHLPELVHRSSSHHSPCEWRRRSPIEPEDPVRRMPPEVHQRDAPVPL